MRNGIIARSPIDFESEEIDYPSYFGAIKNYVDSMKIELAEIRDILNSISL